MNALFTKLKQDYEALLAKLGIISARLLQYVQIAIFLAGSLLKLLTANNPTVTAIEDLLPKGLEPALVDDIIEGLQKGIAYLTQSQTVLAAATPAQTLQLFLNDLKADVPGLQKSKIWTLVTQVVAYLDGNSQPSSVYTMLVAKYQTINAPDA